MKWYIGDRIDLGVELDDLECVQVPGCGYSQDVSQDSPGNSDDQALEHEDPGRQAPVSAHSRHYRYVPSLFHYHEYQGTHDIQGCDEHYQADGKKHGQLFQLQG